jgi:hypothetical protein
LGIERISVITISPKLIETSLCDAATTMLRFVQKMLNWEKNELMHVIGGKTFKKRAHLSSVDYDLIQHKMYWWSLVFYQRGEKKT